MEKLKKYSCAIAIGIVMSLFSMRRFVLWDDGTKTVVKCQEYDEFSFEKGLLLCIAKKAYGNTGRFNDILREMMDRAYLQELPTRRVRLEDWITAPC